MFFFTAFDLYALSISNKGTTFFTPLEDCEIDIALSASCLFKINNSFKSNAENKNKDYEEIN